MFLYIAYPVPSKKTRQSICESYASETATTSTFFSYSCSSCNRSPNSHGFENVKSTRQPAWNSMLYIIKKYSTISTLCAALEYGILPSEKHRHAKNQGSGFWKSSFPLTLDNPGSTGNPIVGNRDMENGTKLSTGFSHLYKPNLK